MKDQEKLPKFELICSADELRPSTGHVFLTRENFVATDAHLMAWATTSDFFNEDFIKDIPAEGVLIHREDWKKLRTCTYFQWKKGLIEINYSKKRKVFIEPETQDEVGKYPNWSAVIPSNDEEPKQEIGLNPEFLVKLGHALGFGLDTNNLKLTFHKGYRAITARPVGHGGKNIRGLIMPVMIDK